jgi:phosphopantothenoylcysteine synthetase/decarboxylase
MRVLITSGPTREPIDDVRFVSNVSTGRLGVTIATAFLAAGHSVVFLRGVGSAAPDDHPALDVVEFTSTESLLEILRRRLAHGARRPDVWIHAAAVADYAPARVEGKIKSDRDSLVIEMRPTPKVADTICREHGDVPLVLFKLESSIPRAELHVRANRTLRRVGAAAIVANLLEEVTATSHRADLLRADGSSESFDTRLSIANGLVAEAERLATSSLAVHRSLE